MTKRENDILLEAIIKKAFNNDLVKDAINQALVMTIITGGTGLSTAALNLPSDLFQLLINITTSETINSALSIQDSGKHTSLMYVLAIHHGPVAIVYMNLMFILIV